MALVPVDLTIPQGATFTVYWDLIDPTTGLPITSTSGFTVKFQIRPEKGSATLLYSFPGPIWGASRVTFTAPAADTAALTFGVAYYDVAITDASTKVTRIAEGRVFLDPAVSV